MESVVRKISIGSDYKNDAMHYCCRTASLWRSYYYQHILTRSMINSYSIFIKKEDEVMPWKKFNSNMAISVEYDLEY